MVNIYIQSEVTVTEVCESVNIQAWTSSYSVDPRSGKSQGKSCCFQGHWKVREFEIGQGKMIFWAKVREFYDEGALVVQLLSFIDQKAKKVSSILYYCCHY